MAATIDTSPPIFRLTPGSSFDPSVFTRSIPVLAARIPAAKTTTLTKQNPVKRFVLDIPRIRSVLSDPEDPNKRLVLLRVPHKCDLPQEAQEFLDAETEKLFLHYVELDYSYWTADDILQAILPEDLGDGSPSSFTITGHLAHFNLREEYLPYKHIIGQIVLDKNKGLRTVVNKLDNIDNEFRFFKMEVLAGEPDFVVEAHESGCRFKFDFSQVYWNSRLHSEHERLVTMFNPSDVIADVFAGVGPFVVPAAKKGCAVFGNDLNPNSAKYMAQNAEENKVGNRVRVSCQDGRQFIKQVLYEAWHNPFPGLVGPVKSHKQAEREDRKRRNHKLPETPNEPEVPSPPRRRVDHFVMNLPGTALEFLDAFRGSLASIRDEAGFGEVYDVMPMIHCHCFTRELERLRAETDIRERAENALGHGLEDVKYHFVRKVAPNKDMYCLSFRLPSSIT